MKDSKLVLVTNSEKWSAQDYGIDSQDMLCVQKCDINKEIRARGGAKFVIGETLSSTPPPPNSTMILIKRSFSLQSWINLNKDYNLFSTRCVTAPR